MKKTLLLFGLCMLFLVATATASIEDGLITYYKHDNSSSNTTDSFDSLGDYNGTISGATRGVDGIVNEAFDYDGINDKVDLPFDSGIFTNQLTFSTWINIESVALCGSAAMGIIDGDLSSNRGNSLAVSCPSKSISFSIYNNTGSNIGATTNNLNLNEWYHIVGVLNGTKALIYVNGELNATSVSTFGGTIKDNNLNFDIGYNQYGLGSHLRWFNGKIDEVGIWNRSLSSDEIETLYNFGAANSYAFNEGLNLTDSNPADDYYTKQPQVSFNTTADATNDFNCSLFLDDVSQETKNYSAGTSVSVEFEKNLSIGTYDYYIFCTDYIGNNKSTLTKSVYFNSTNTLNITFLDEITGNVITDSIDVEFISDSENSDYSTSTGNLYVALTSPTTYTIRYDSTANSYNQNHYIFSLTNRTDNTLTLYLNNHSNNFTATVYDGLTLNKIPNAVVYLQKRMSNGSYEVVSIQESDSLGKTYFSSDTDEYYKFVVHYPFGAVKLTTDKTYIKSDSINLYISLTAPLGEIFFDTESITSVLSYDETDREFVVTWTDTESVATSFCLYVKEFGYYGKTITNSSCSSSASGSIELAVPAANDTYYALFTAYIDGSERTVRTGWIELLTDDLNAGAFGLFLTACLIIIFALMGGINMMALVLANGGLIAAKLLHLIALDWGYVIVVVISSLILAIIINMRR